MKGRTQASERGEAASFSPPSPGSADSEAAASRTAESARSRGNKSSDRLPHSRSWTAVWIALPLAAIAACWRHPGWPAMFVIALAEWTALKLATVSGYWRRVPVWRLAGYLLFWPGMDARAFFFAPLESVRRPPAAELVFALGKTIGGAALIVWAAAHVDVWPDWLAAWMGMIGGVFAIHFGGCHAASWLWRRAGVEAAPIMRTPVLAQSLAEFWGERWNIAFAVGARRFVLRPLSRRIGVRAAGAVVFLISGIIHETAISVPAGGGWGGPTAYFLLQALGAWIERGKTGRRWGLGRGGRGWLWTLFVAAAPAPLLFHPPFIERVIGPLLEALAKLA